MALSFEQKEAVVAEVRDVASRAHAVIGAEYRGLSVAAMSSLREKARGANVRIRVVKNTLARRAFEGTEFSGMDEHLVGPLVLAFGMDDPGSVGRVARDFAKDHDDFAVKIIALGGQVLGPSQLEDVAKLPTYDEAVSQLLSVMKAPVQKLAATLNEVPGKLVRTVAAIRDSKTETG